MPKTILIADDNPAIREIFRRMVAQDASFGLCAEAANGKEAIALAQRLNPDLVVLDVSMPVMNGLDAAKELRRLMPQVAIIIFTGYQDALATFDHGLPANVKIVPKTDPNLMQHIRDTIPA
jgi:YesN/AraC family two-component response regulator